MLVNDAAVAFIRPKSIWNVQSAPKLMAAPLPSHTPPAGLRSTLRALLRWLLVLIGLVLIVGIVILRRID